MEELVHAYLPHVSCVDFCVYICSCVDGNNSRYVFNPAKEVTTIPLKTISILAVVNLAAVP